MITTKKFLPVIIVLFIVVIVGVGIYAYKNGGLSIFSRKNSTSFSGTLKAAIKLGIPLKCQYTVNGMEAEGFIKGTNWRGKMKMADGQKGEVIIKDNCLWSWAENQNQGGKMCFKPAADGKTIWDQPQQGAQTDVEYKCSAAIVTDATFTPPANIKFMDIDQQSSTGN